MALLAPFGPGGGVGRIGPGDVAEALPWESAGFAGLLADGGLEDPRAAERLRRYDVALAYTRNGVLARNVGRLVSRVVQHDPAPPAGGPHAAEWLASCLPAIGVPVGSAGLPPSCPPRTTAARAA